MKRANIVFLSLALLLSLAFTGDAFVYIKSIPVEAEKISTDNLGSFYLSKGTTLNKYDSEGNFLKNFSNKYNGSISSVDASNPLRLLVFYQGFQQIIFLDNMLAPAGSPVSLQALGYRQTTAACISSNNGFWIFDKQNSELIKFDNNLQKIFQSGNIVQLTGNRINPVFLMEQNNSVLVCDTTVGVLVFDGYATYNKTLPIKDVKQLQALNNMLVYFQERKMKSYNMKTLEQEEINLPDTNIIMARAEKEKLYLLKQKSIDIYQIKR